MKEIILVLVGGVCSALGGMIAIWCQAKYARKIRMEEVRGEQQLEACKKALSLIDRIWTQSRQCTEEDTLGFIKENNEWFSMNQVLLPHTFVENWRSIRNNLLSIQGCEEMLENTNEISKRESIIKKKQCCTRFVWNLIDEADETLRKELGLRKVNIKRPEHEKE